MALIRVFSPSSTHSEDAFLSRGCQLYYSTGSLGSVVLSMTSFHGRGFFPGGIGLDDPLTMLAAIEAFVDLSTPCPAQPPLFDARHLDPFDLYPAPVLQ